MQRLNSVQGIVVEINFSSDNTITINFIWSISLSAVYCQRYNEVFNYKGTVLIEFELAFDWYFVRVDMDCVKVSNRLKDTVITSFCLASSLTVL